MTLPAERIAELRAALEAARPYVEWAAAQPAIANITEHRARLLASIDDALADDPEAFVERLGMDEA